MSTLMNIEVYFNCDRFDGLYNGMAFVDMVDCGRDYEVTLEDENCDKYAVVIPKYEDIELPAVERIA